MLVRLYVRNQLIALLNTIHEGVKYSKGASLTESQMILNDCILAVDSIKSALKDFLSEKRFIHYNNIIKDLTANLVQLTNKKDSKSINKLDRIVYRLLYSLKITLRDEPEVKIEILFLPYKSSMWDTFDSIWRAAKKDSRCICKVVPIPYFDRDNNGKVLDLHYEGKQLPLDVEITHYENYNIAAARPDIIYIHNPYDNTNLITTVHPDYYSENLKKYTDMLVYVPYYVAATMFKSYEECKTKPYHLYSGVKNADFVIAQSQVYKNAMVKSGFDESRIKVLGSPKIDAIINSPKNNPEMPEKWKDKLKGKKVFLLNSSIANLLSNNLEMWGEEDIFSFYNKFIDYLISNDSCAFIWRPHPLLENTIRVMRPQYLDEYIKTKEKVLEAENAVFDDTPDFHLAVNISDALISDASSIARLYIATGKPILDITSTEKYISRFRYYTLDYSGSYFYRSGVTIEKFVDMVLSGSDTMQNKRLELFKKSIANADGTCGENVHNTILDEFLKKPLLKVKENL